MRKIIFWGLLLLIPVAYATSVYQSAITIRYTGTTGQTESFQPLSTGYTQTAEGIGIYCSHVGGCNSSTTIQLQECDDSGYSTNCSYVATTDSFPTSSVDGNQESYSDFTSSYEHDETKYYRLRWTSSSHRIQCGGDGDEAPIDHGEATPSSACGSTGRVWVYKLYGTEASTSTTSTEDLTNLEIGLSILFGLSVFSFFANEIRNRKKQ